MVAPIIALSITTLQFIISPYLSKGYDKVAGILILNEADINAEGYNNMTPLHVAAFNGNFSSIHNNFNLLLIIFKCKYLQFCLGHSNVAEVLLRSRALPNAKAAKNLTPLHVAALKGKYWYIDKLEFPTQWNFFQMQQSSIA